MIRKAPTIERILEHYPVRIAITDYCNLRCFFCSNEGMHLARKNKSHMNFQDFKYIVGALKSRGLNKLSLTGGDPTMHPEIDKIIDFLAALKFKELFFHTNGCFLKEELVKKLTESFTKLAVSVHATDFEVWRRITNGSRQQFDKQRANLEMLAGYRDKIMIEVKYVPLCGYNDSPEEIRSFLEICNKNKFKFKFLNFEAITREQNRLVIPFGKIKNILEEIGCQMQDDDTEFRGQKNYLPIKKFVYKDTFGVAIEIGCGDPRVCEECYQSNEVFITPYLAIKPCHVDDFEIDISDTVKHKNDEALLQALVDSRVFLMKRPGEGRIIWQNYQ